MAQPVAKDSRLPLAIAALGLIVALAALLTATRKEPSGTATARQSAMERILQTGKIRCSYLVYPPYVRKDPNSGELSGIFHDVMNQLAVNAGLTVDWVEEVGYENIFPGLDSARHDVFCGGLWPNASRAKAAAFSEPIFYSVIKTWVRTDESRFSRMDALNDPAVSIATIDGAMEDIIARTDFPKAKRLSLPQLSPFTQNFLNITSRKADLTFAEPGIVFEFLKTNPGTLKEIFGSQPQRIFGNSLVIRRGDDQLREFLNAGLRELLYTGRVDKILTKYEPGANVFPRVATPYTQK